MLDTDSPDHSDGESKEIRKIISHSLSSLEICEESWASLSGNSPHLILATDFVSSHTTYFRHHCTFDWNQKRQVAVNVGPILWYSFDQLRDFEKCWFKHEILFFCISESLFVYGIFVKKTHSDVKSPIKLVWINSFVW